MIILHIANLDDNKSVGPNINVPQNVIYGNKFADVALYNLCEVDPPIKLPKEKYFSFRIYKKISELPKPYNNPDIVIFQCVYFMKYCKIAKELIKRNIPYVIVPRCSLTTAALKSRALKKKIANIFFFNKFIKNAKYIQFLTQNEYEESKNNFKIKDYYILGNGIELPQKKYEVKNRKEFKIVFIGRLNVYHKGLDILLEAISENIEWIRDKKIIFNFYGIDSENGIKYIKNYIEYKKINDIIRINKPVYDKEKERVLLDSDIFIHTSRLEGQPTAVIEAISYGIPVIVTPGTNIADIVKDNNMGFTCDLNIKSIFERIKLAFENKNNFNIISENEIEYAKNNFDWNTIIKKAINNYKQK